MFRESIKSKHTANTYAFVLASFKKQTGIADLTKIESKQLEKRMIEFVISLKHRGISYSHQNNYISALKKFCRVFDIEGINWEKVWDYTSEPETNRTDKPYTREQIESMLLRASIRDKAIILLSLSTGCRVGGIASLRVGDLTEIDGFTGYRVQVYATSKKYAYTTFCTPEARKAIDLYLGERKIKKEILTPSSPLFRTEFKKVAPMSEYTIRAAINVCAKAIGLRPKIDRKARHATASTHGFRKMANTAFVKAGVRPVYGECLLGHKKGLQDNYLRIDDTDLLNDYIKAIPMLTISKEDELKADNERLLIENATIDELKARLMNKDYNNEAFQSASYEAYKAQDELEEMRQTMGEMKAEIERMKQERK